MKKITSIILCLCLAFGALPFGGIAFGATDMDLITDPDIAQSNISLLKTEKNLLTGYKTGAAQVGEPGSFTITGYNGKDTSSGIWANGVINNGSVIDQDDVNLFPYVYYLDENKEFIEGVYTDITINLTTEAKFESIFIVQPVRNITYHSWKYDVYWGDTYADLYSPENLKYSYEKEPSADSCYQTFPAKTGDDTASFIGIRIHRGVSADFSHLNTLSYVRLGEIAVFGKYNAPYYDYTVKESTEGGATLDIDSGNTFSGRKLSHTFDISRDGYIFKHFTLNGTPIEEGVQRDYSENKVTLNWNITKQSDIVAVYAPAPQQFSGSFCSAFEEKGMVAVPAGSIANDILIYTEATIGKDNIAVKRNGSALTSSQFLKKGDTVEISSTGGFSKEYTLAFGGDVNEDGSITVTDLTSVMNEIYKSGTYNFQRFKADANGDKALTVGDAVAVRDGILKSNETALSYSKKTLTLSDIDYKYIGRDATVDAKDKNGRDKKAIYLEAVASGIEFNAYCYGDIKLDLYAGYLKYYLSVEVDGVETDFYISDKADTYVTLTIAKRLRRGLHNIKIRRQGEGGYEYLFDVSLNGSIGPKPANKALQIDFLGDSITCGEGNLSVDGTFNGRHQNGVKSYATMTADRLDADYFLISRGAHTLVQVAEEHTGTAPSIIPKYYKTAYSLDKNYSFSRKADIVVINLGTNDVWPLDFAGFKTPAKQSAEFKKQLLKFIDELKKKNGSGVKIVFAYGMMNDYIPSNPNSHFGNVYKEVAAISKTDNIFYCPLDKDTSGGLDHPSMAGHIKAADKLTKFIQSQVL